MSRSLTPFRRAAAEKSGSSFKKVWSPLQTSLPAPIASKIQARQSSGSRPPCGAIPISRTSNPRASPSCIDPSTGIAPPKPRTSWTVFPACSRSTTPTTRSGR